MSPDEETGVQINVEAAFQFMYNMETGVNLNPDIDFHFTVRYMARRSGIGMAWVMGMRMGV